MLFFIHSSKACHIRASQTRGTGGVPDILHTCRQVYINHKTNKCTSKQAGRLSASSHHPDGSKALQAAELHPEQMAEGRSRRLPLAAKGRLVCLFMIRSSLRALITCTAPPPGSGDEPANNEAAVTRSAAVITTSAR